jgi:drug/metabolite transporter (DMT)-like permease
MKMILLAVVSFIDTSLSLVSGIWRPRGSRWLGVLYCLASLLCYTYFVDSFPPSSESQAHLAIYIGLSIPAIVILRLFADWLMSDWAGGWDMLIASTIFCVAYCQWTRILTRLVNPNCYES